MYLYRNLTSVERKLVVSDSSCDAVGTELEALVLT